MNYPSLFLNIASLGFVIAAAGLWAGAGVDTRPKYRDEQTLVGGTLWSQTMTPMGLLLSTMVEDKLDVFVHGYFLLIGLALLITTGILLIVEELCVMKRSVPRRNQSSTMTGRSSIQMDKIYLLIGILCIFSAVCKAAEFIMIIIAEF